MKTIHLIANGDLRIEAKRTCEAAQAEMEKQHVADVERQGAAHKRTHSFDPQKKHGFIDSQKYGMEVFRKIPTDEPLIVAEAVWQYSHHVLHGLLTHRGPILTVANWSGTWPGLVGMLNLNGSLTKAGVAYSTLWSEDFSDDFFHHGLRKWLHKGAMRHRADHVTPLDDVKVPRDVRKLATAIAHKLQREKAIMGVFDEGCMGMFNAIIPDHLMHPTGVYKERLSQSALYYETNQVTDNEAREVLRWYQRKGSKFKFGKRHEAEWTEAPLLKQHK